MVLERFHLTGEERPLVFEDEKEWRKTSELRELTETVFNIGKDL